MIIIITIFGSVRAGRDTRGTNAAVPPPPLFLGKKNHLWSRLNLFRVALGARGTLPGPKTGRTNPPPAVPPPGVPALCSREEQLLPSPAPPASLPGPAPGGGSESLGGLGSPRPLEPRAGPEGEAPGRGPEEKDINKRGG